MPQSDDVSHCRVYFASRGMNFVTLMQLSVNKVYDFVSWLLLLGTDLNSTGVEIVGEEMGRRLRVYGHGMRKMGVMKMND